MTYNISKLITFFHNIKIFERPPKLTKNMLSPSRNRCTYIRKNKRKASEEDPKNSHENKRKKQCTNNVLEKYNTIMIDQHNVSNNL